MALLPSEEYSIADLARSIASNFGDRQVIFDTTKADGQYRKCMSNNDLRGLLANFEFTSLNDGIALTVQDYIANKHKYRHGEAKL
jgi:GDP-L-fucose synthase